MWNALSHSTEHAILCVPGPDVFNKSVRGDSISEKDGMKVRKKFTIPKNKRRCFTVSGVDHSTTADTLDSVGDQPSVEILFRWIIRLCTYEQIITVPHASPYSNVIV